MCAQACLDKSCLALCVHAKMPGGFVCNAHIASISGYKPVFSSTFKTRDICWVCMHTHGHTHARPSTSMIYIFKPRIGPGHTHAKVCVPARNGSVFLCPWLREGRIFVYLCLNGHPCRA